MTQACAASRTRCRKLDHDRISTGVAAIAAIELRARDEGTAPCWCVRARALAAGILFAYLAIVVVAIVAIARHWVPWQVVPVLSLAIGAGFAGLTFVGSRGAARRDRPRTSGSSTSSGSSCFMPFLISPRLWIGLAQPRSTTQHESPRRSGRLPDARRAIERARDQAVLGRRVLARRPALARRAEPDPRLHGAERRISCSRTGARVLAARPASARDRARARSASRSGARSPRSSASSRSCSCSCCRSWSRTRA